MEDKKKLRHFLKDLVGCMWEITDLALPMKLEILSPCCL